MDFSCSLSWEGLWISEVPFLLQYIAQETDLSDCSNSMSPFPLVPSWFFAWSFKDGSTFGKLSQVCLIAPASYNGTVRVQERW